jgi:hypothetical protein
MGNRAKQEMCRKRGKDGPTKREKAVAEVTKATKTKRFYHVWQKEAQNRLLQSMRVLVDDIPKSSLSRDIQRTT